MSSAANYYERSGLYGQEAKRLSGDPVMQAHRRAVLRERQLRRQARIARAREIGAAGVRGIGRGIGYVGRGIGAGFGMVGNQIKNDCEVISRNHWWILILLLTLSLGFQAYVLIHSYTEWKGKYKNESKPDEAYTVALIVLLVLNIVVAFMSFFGEGNNHFITYQHATQFLVINTIGIAFIAYVGLYWETEFKGKEKPPTIYLVYTIIISILAGILIIHLISCINRGKNKLHPEEAAALAEEADLGAGSYINPAYDPNYDPSDEIEGESILLQPQSVPVLDDPSAAVEDVYAGYSGGFNPGIKHSRSYAESDYDLLAKYGLK